MNPNVYSWIFEFQLIHRYLLESKPFLTKQEEFCSSITILNQANQVAKVQHLRSWYVKKDAELVRVFFLRNDVNLW